MKLFSFHPILLCLILILSSCASHKDQVFTEADPTSPEQLQREISIPENLKSKFEVKDNPKVIVDQKSAKQGGDSCGKEDKNNQDSQDKQGQRATVATIVKKQDAKALAKPTPKPTPVQLTDEELKKKASFKTWDIESKRVWKKFTPYVRVGEELIYEISFLGVLAGHVRMTTKPVTKVGDKEVYHFYAQLRSGRWYDFIYKLDDYIETFIDKETFRPIKYSLIQRESSQKVDDLQLFDFDSGMTYLDYYRLKDGQEKKENKAEMIPEYFQDSYSALPFMRGVEMKVGDVHQFPIVTRGKIWLLKYEVIGVEEVKVQGEWIKALKIKAETQYPGVLEKKGDILFWFDQSDLRRPVKFQAKVKIGAIEGILTDYKPGKKIE